MLPKKAVGMCFRNDLDIYLTFIGKIHCVQHSVRTSGRVTFLKPAFPVAFAFAVIYFSQTYEPGRRRLNGGKLELASKN